ncbi:MAG: response regulator [Bacteroidales bacterium]|nr:response regulator [Bacteroidales bacterium]
MKPTTILVVDDQPEYLKAYATLFFEEQVPYKIISAIHGKMAIDLARSEHPDIIIMDWQMPEMDGFTALKHLKSDPELHTIPVIIASGIMLESNDLKKALEAGASDYIRKPIDRTELLARTHSHIRMAHYLKTIREQEQALLNERDNRIDLLAESSFMLSSQMGEMIRVFIHEHEKMTEAIQNQRKRGKSGEEITDIILQNLLQNQQVFKRYLQAGHEPVKDEFYIRQLVTKHPSLLPSEIELCLLLKKNLSSKEIASITFKSPNTIKVARSRIRQKMGLDKKFNLFKYLNSMQ